MAFQAARTVTLTVQARANPGTAVANSPSTPTVRLGARLHVVVVTAVTPASAPLVPGVVYDYDIAWTATVPDAFTAANLLDAGLRKAAGGVVYADGALPSFALPPADIAKVKLVHGSCRKAHSVGGDALPVVDSLIASAVGDPEARPHQLFLTGDQIYADDVPDTQLDALTGAGDVLLGWTETLPGVNKPPGDLKPGRRTQVAKATGGTGAGVTSEDEAAKSHLFGLGEFYAMYLFNFSPAPWPAKLRGFADLFPTEAAEHAADVKRRDDWIRDHAVEKTGVPPPVRHVELKDRCDAEVANVTGFVAALPNVRRALANVPTYTILDDHEVADDWNMNKAWAKRVLDQPLGRRLVRNGLLAYATFQAWGNTPERFAAGQPGASLLTLAASATPPSGFSAPDATALDAALNVTTGAAMIAAGGPTHAAGTLDWHYRVAVDGAPYEVLLFDTRTWRAFAPADMDPPQLIRAVGFQSQMQSFGTPPATSVVTIAIVPGPVFDLPYVSELKNGKLNAFPHGWIAGLKDAFVLDREMWEGSPVAQERLLANLFARSASLVVLAGDVHMGYTARLVMWASKLFEHPTVARTGVMAQFTCSPLCNEDHGLAGTYKFTTGGFDRATLDSGTVPDKIDVAGWNAPPGGVTIGRKVSGGIPPFWNFYEPWNLKRVPAVLRVDDIPIDSELIPEDWRYQVHFLESDTGVFARSLATTKVPPGSSADGLKNARELLRKGGGKQVVGANNLGVVTFPPQSGKLGARQELWWRVEGVPTPAPYSRWTTSLDPAAYPKPAKLPGVP